jgi:acyl dehydratase
LVNEQWSGKVGDVIALSKTVSEADIALFGLINRDDAFVPEDPAPPVRQPRQMAPYPLLASLLATAASHLLREQAKARFLRQRIEFFWPVYTDDTLELTVEVSACDEATHTLNASVICLNQDRHRLAQGEFILDTGPAEEP